MIIEDKLIEVIINSRTIKYYEELLKQELKNKQIITIMQKDVYKKSRVVVECICDICQKPFRRPICNIRSTSTLCSNICRNKFLILNNPNPTKDKIKVCCNICNKEIEINESKFKKQKYFLCSRDCYKKHRSEIYRGENLYNYQNIMVPCSYCNNEVKTIEWEIANRKHIFCSQECYFIFRKENYKEVYFATYLNDFRK
ncbi:MAG: hypothetical protein LKI16_21300, partial [Heyndrickxia oleronia]|nr:hypothetical protein [Heyndrickxia oleronia]